MLTAIDIGNRFPPRTCVRPPNVPPRHPMESSMMRSSRIMIRPQNPSRLSARPGHRARRYDGGLRQRGTRSTPRSRHSRTRSRSGSSRSSTSRRSTSASRRASSPSATSTSTLETAQGGAAIVPGVVSGQYQFGFSNVVSLLLAQSRNVPIKVVANGINSTGDAGKPTSAASSSRTRPSQPEAPGGQEGRDQHAEEHRRHLGQGVVRKAGGDPDEGRSSSSCRSRTWPPRWTAAKSTRSSWSSRSCRPR